MEIELKYLADKDTAEKMFTDEKFRELVKEDTLEVLKMRAIYYDASDKSLRKKGISVRARYENDNIVATVKWGGGSKGSLHMRGEVNVNVDESFVKNPTVEVFKGVVSEQGEDIYKMLAETMVNAETVLVPLLEMHFTRTQIHLDTGMSESIVSYDAGEIITSNGSVPISEIEIELAGGQEQDMIATGMALAKRFDLKAEADSKLKRGLKLL